MKTHRIACSELDAARIDGRVNGRDLRDEAGRMAFRKGRVLSGADADRLRELPWSELHLIEPEPGDVHEEEAGGRVVAAVAGEGTVEGESGGGAWPVTARWRGILEVDVTRLHDLNSSEGLVVYTLLSGQVVDGGETIARVKVIPLVLPGERVAAAEAIAREGEGVLRVRPFRPRRVGAVVQQTLSAAERLRLRALLREKLGWFGSELVEPVHADQGEEGLAAAMERVVGAGAEVVVLAGSKAMDPLDPAFGALERLGGELVRHGVPAHPGSLFFVARLPAALVLGMPNCGLLEQGTVFDVVLARVLAGLPIDSSALAELGHGGLLGGDVATRLPRYRADGERGVLPIEER